MVDVPTYTLGNSKSVLDILERRSADCEGAFLLPYLSNGISLLDCGCGIGTISQGYKTYFPDIYLFGIDIDPKVISIAQRLVKQRHLMRSEYVVSDVCAIPFASESFDVVFGHTILMQLNNPLKCIEEVKRVLLPRGLVAFREADYRFDEYSRAIHLKNFWDIYCHVMVADKRNPFVGIELPALLRSSGFRLIDFKVIKQEMDISDEAINLFLKFVSEAEFLDRAVEMGMLTHKERVLLPELILKESRHSDFKCKRTYCEILARNG